MSVSEYYPKFLAKSFPLKESLDRLTACPQDIQLCNSSENPQSDFETTLKPNGDKALCGFDRGFFAIALHLNRMHSLILQNLRDQYYGDLDQAHIACVLMMVTVGGNLLYTKEALRLLGNDGLPDPAQGPWPRFPQRISELAAATGLPRETVRRKLLQLEENGLVRRDSNGRWLWEMADAGKTRGVYREQSRRFLFAVEQLRELLQKAERLLKS